MLHGLTSWTHQKTGRPSRCFVCDPRWEKGGLSKKLKLPCRKEFRENAGVPHHGCVCPTEVQILQFRFASCKSASLIWFGPTGKKWRIPETLSLLTWIFQRTIFQRAVYCVRAAPFWKYRKNSTMPVQNGRKDMAKMRCSGFVHLRTVFCDRAEFLQRCIREGLSPSATDCSRHDNFR